MEIITNTKKKTPTCPKMDKCNASVCPIIKLGKHLKDEHICLYAREFVKEGSKERFKEHSLEWMYESLTDNLDWLLRKSGDIRKRLAKAAQTPTSLTAPKKIH